MVLSNDPDRNVSLIGDIHKHTTLKQMIKFCQMSQFMIVLISYQLIKLFLDKKMSIFEQYGSFKAMSRWSVYLTTHFLNMLSPLSA